jgi:protein SCO1/2
VRNGWLLALLWLPTLVLAADPAAQVKLVPQIGAALPRDGLWHDEYGHPVSLAAITDGHPTLLVLAYYHCPMLCPRVLHGLASSLRGSDLIEDMRLRVVVASIDPRDTSTEAIAARQGFIDRALLPESAVHFLTGPSSSSRALAAAVGISYAYDAEHEEYAHPATYILTDDKGRVARYLPAFTTTARDLRLTLTEVDTGQPAGLWDHALLLCYAYDPETGRYTLAIQNLLRLAALLTVVLLVALFARQHRRSGR